MPSHRVRPIAICVFWKDDSILVLEGHDAVKGETFYRPLGGGIEFGEYSREAVAREIYEELGAEVRDLRFLGVIENVFRYEGEPWHEIVLVYGGKLADARLYDVQEMEGCEDGSVAMKVLWKPLSDFRSGRAILYPTGLMEMLDAQGPPEEEA